MPMPTFPLARILKSVEVAYETVDEATVKIVELYVSVAPAWIVKRAKGEVEPTLRFEAKYAFNDVVAPPAIVSPPVCVLFPIVDEASE